MISFFPKSRIEEIRRDGPRSAVYLRRYWIIKTRWINVYVHNILLPDDEPAPHSHPWSFITLILRGGYVDETWCVGSWIGSRGFEIIPKLSHKEPMAPGTLRFRAAEHTHRVRSVDANTWTLVISGPKRREWGFWTREGWVHWRKYLGVP